MDIRKEFKYEMAHIVRKARTERCSKNIHGHSYVAELVFEGDIADKAEMLLDFGIIKKVF
jgi:6-pyruvoyltetrahydropterin/6-carboxytetrahydropterin synthase